MGKLGICIALIAVLGGLYMSGIFSDTSPPEQPGDGWWGRGPKQSAEDTTIREFKVQVTKETLDDLDHRLRAARLGEDLENTTFEYGFQVNYMKEVLEYWKTKYDWRKHEAILNSFAQYKTQIEGIDIHFLRVQPLNKGRGTARPLLLVHGWPGSVWEFYKMIPMLTDPANHGGQADEAFEVICPSIPGYGFSEAPHQQGFDAVAASRIFVKLMRRLGHDKFFYQGGDWGALIGSVISTIYPEHVLGVHLNIVWPQQSNIKVSLKQMVLAVWPSLLLNEDERKQFPGVGTFYKILLRESGYMHLQATRPDTVAFSLNDSPVGLAAYILEKFSVWTIDNGHELPDGGLTSQFTLDELLTNIMVYWVTGSIGSSMRFYKENINSQDNWDWDWVPVTVPTGLAAFPEEIFNSPKVLVTDKYVNLVHYNDTFQNGGHFAALQVPELLSADFVNFVRKVEKSVPLS